MSRFQELCKAIEKDRKRWHDYHRECLAFARELVNGLIQYLQCPEGCVQYVPTVGDHDPDKRYYLPGAMRLNDDPFYHFGVILAFDVYAPVVLVPFLIRKIGDSFEVRIEDLDQDFEIHEDRLDELKTVYEFLFELIMGTFEMGFQQWLGQDTRQEKQPLGFYRPPLPEDEK